MSLHAVPLQDLVAFRQTTAEDELEETVQDEDLESNKELLLLSLGRARNLARNGLKVYIYIYIYIYLICLMNLGACLFSRTPAISGICRACRSALQSCTRSLG